MIKLILRQGEAASRLPHPPETAVNPTENATSQAQPQVEATPAVEPMPMRKMSEKDKNTGKVEEWDEPDYLATTPQRVHSYIYNESGLSRADANTHVEENLKDAQDAVAKHAKSAPKIGKQMGRYQMQKAKWEQEGAEKQKAVDFWEQVKAEQAKVVAAERENRDRRVADAKERGTGDEQVLSSSNGNPTSGEQIPAGAESPERGTRPLTDSGTGETIESNIERDGRLFQYFSGTLQELLSNARSAAKGLVKKVISPVSERLQNDLKERGIDVDNSYNHVIDNNAIRHAIKNHGGESERKRGQLPITDADFERIEDVVNNYDSIEVEEGKRNSNIIYSKTFEDGTTIYVEEKRDGRKELAAVTMWKKKNPTLTDANPNEGTPISDLSRKSADKVNTSSADKQEKGAESSPQLADVQAEQAKTYGEPSYIDLLDMTEFEFDYTKAANVEDFMKAVHHDLGEETVSPAFHDRVLKWAQKAILKG